MGVHGDAMETRMLARGLASRTRVVYVGWMRRLVRFSRTPADQVSEEQALAFVADLARRGRSGSTINQALGAIKFFYTEVVPRAWGLSTPYQRFPQRLPVILSREEVRRLLEASEGLRQRAAMEIAYAAGLRLNEASAPQGGRHRLRADGDSREAGQGEEGPRRDALARRCWRHCEPTGDKRSPRGYLFPGKKAGSPLNPTIFQRGFAVARRAGANREGGKLPFPAPQLRHAPDGERRERAYDSGPAGSPQPRHHRALHPRGRRVPEADAEPAGHAARELDELSRGGPRGPPAGGRRDPQALRSRARLPWGGSPACGP